MLYSGHQSKQIHGNSEEFERIKILTTEDSINAQ